MLGWTYAWLSWWLDAGVQLAAARVTQVTVPRIEQVSTAIMAAAAVVMAVAAIRRPITALPPTMSAPTYHEEWRKFPEAGVTEGLVDAEIQLVEFADLECPFCARVQPTLDSIQRSLGRRASLTFVHFPLSSHRFALPAARAAECAAHSGKFMAFTRAVYEGQDSLGLRSWESFANAAGIADTAGVGRCAREPGTPARVRSGLDLGKRLQLTGTPTIVVNGWLFRGAVDGATLSAAIDALMDGRNPANSAK